MILINNKKLYFTLLYFFDDRSRKLESIQIIMKSEGTSRINNCFVDLEHGWLAITALL